MHYKRRTLKQVGHMVMLTSGSRERKYSHLSGLGQRLISTSLLLMARSTGRLTLTGTKFEPPCCLYTKMNHYRLRPFTLSSWLAHLAEYLSPHLFCPFSYYLKAHFGCKWIFLFIVQTLIHPQRLEILLCLFENI